MRRAAILALVLSACGPVRYDLRDELVTLRENSDAPEAPPLQIQEPTLGAQSTGFCLLTFSGEHPFALWYWRGRDGTNCWVRVGAKATATLIFVEGQDGFSVLSLRWMR